MVLGLAAGQFEAGRGKVGAWGPTGLLRAVLVRSTLQG